MSELIVVTPEIRQATLIVEDMTARIKLAASHYVSLVQVAKEGNFKPDPPAILARLPDPYEGQFTYFVYNGNTRYLVAGDYGADLNGLVVDSDDEIPAGELLYFKPAWDPSEKYGLLRHALRNVLTKYSDAPRDLYSLDELLLELMRQERRGLLTPEPPWYRPRLTPAQLDQISALDISSE